MSDEGQVHTPPTGAEQMERQAWDALGTEYRHDVTVQLVISPGEDEDGDEPRTVDIWTASLNAVDVARLTKGVLRLRPEVPVCSCRGEVAAVVDRLGPGRTGDPTGRIMA